MGLVKKVTNMAIPPGGEKVRRWSRNEPLEGDESAEASKPKKVVTGKGARRAKEVAEAEIKRRRKSRGKKGYEGVLTGMSGDVSAPTVTRKPLLGQ
jgi:hypothetical protein